MFKRDFCIRWTELFHTPWITLLAASRSIWWCSCEGSLAAQRWTILWILWSVAGCTYALRLGPFISMHHNCAPLVSFDNDGHNVTGIHSGYLDSVLSGGTIPSDETVSDNGSVPNGGTLVSSDSSSMACTRLGTEGAITSSMKHEWCILVWVSGCLITVGSVGLDTCVTRLCVTRFNEILSFWLVKSLLKIDVSIN